MQMSKYNVFVKIIDQLRNEAPKGYKRYYPALDQKEKLDNARSRAFLHLYLKVKFGILEFHDRERLITDDPYDGGIDAYYIDDESKCITLIQAKFRTTEENFENKKISIDELLSMDVDRITEGEPNNEEGIKYNSKILAMQEEIGKIPDIGRYRYEVIILANVKEYKQSEFKKLTAGFPVEVFDYERCYKELVFPVVSGTFYDANEIVVNLSLSNKESSEGRISYSVNTEYKDCKITVVFVPLLEIAKIMYKYKNSVLKYNPRSFLSLSHNDVNTKIEDTVINKETNEFALFNNGITILSDGTEFSSKVAKKDQAQLIIKNPQIINGGQTAYTLSIIYEKGLFKDDLTPFENKEVLTKVITFIDDQEVVGCGVKIQEIQRLELIEALSRATNEQSFVKESDRRSNEKVQIIYQEKIYDEFGYFYNRKRGEFYDGLQQKYITKDRVVDPSIFIRAALSMKGEVARARRNGDEVLFKRNFEEVFVDDNSYRKYMFGYMVFEYLVELEKEFSKTKNNKFGINTYGYAIRYGKYAVVNVVSRFYNDDFKIVDYKNQCEKITNEVLLQWSEFETKVSKQKKNKDYFVTVSNEDGTIERNLNFDGYYKGRNINEDIKKYNFIVNI